MIVRLVTEAPEIGHHAERWEELSRGRRHDAGLRFAMGADVSDAFPVVFVVDDDESVRTALRRLLTSAGLAVEIFPTARAFLDSPLPDAPACLVLDVRLPDLNGLDVQKRLSQTGTSLPIVFLTGHGDIPMSVRAIKAGAVEFLTKPFRPHELLDAIRDAIDSDRRAREETKRPQIPPKVG